MSTSPLQGMVVSILSNADIRSVVVMMRVDPQSMISRTFPLQKEAAFGKSDGVKPWRQVGKKEMHSSRVMTEVLPSS